MPAFTPVYALPYQVGTDPPCFGPGTGCDNLETLWCDFAEIAEQQLDQNDLIIGRTATAIPMARITRVFQPGEVNTISPGVANTGFFDTVVFDTDNMAVLPNIIPRRNGIYRIDADMLVLNPDEIGQNLEFQIVIGGDFDVATLGAITSQVDAFCRLQASTLYQFTDTDPIPRVIRLETQSSIAVTAELFSASMTVYWHSDL